MPESALIYVKTAEQSLKRTVNVASGEAELEDLLLVEAGEDLRRRRIEKNIHSAQLAALFRGLEKLLGVLPKIINRLSRSQLQMKP